MFTFADQRFEPSAMADTKDYQIYTPDYGHGVGKGLRELKRTGLGGP